MLARPDDDVTTTVLQRLVIGVVLLVLAIGLGIQVTLEADIDDGTKACIYDFKAVFADGDTVVKKKVNVCEISTFTFTQ